MTINVHLSGLPSHYMQFNPGSLPLYPIYKQTFRLLPVPSARSDKDGAKSANMEAIYTKISKNHFHIYAPLSARFHLNQLIDDKTII